MEKVKALWELRTISLAQVYHVWIWVAALITMVFVSFGICGFRKFFSYAYFMIILTFIMGVLLSAAKG
jgi:hypothetical protein